MSSLILFAPYALLLAAWLWTGAWVHADAQVRGKPPMLVMLMVLLLFWPLGLVFWWVFRPDPRRPPFRLDDFRAG